MIRGFGQFVVLILCLGMVGAGLFMSMEPKGAGVVLERPGTPARLESSFTSATAFFEVDGEALELTMLFTEPHEPESVFKTRVSLREGQSHSIIIGENENGVGAQRYTFRRDGYTVHMHQAPAPTLTAAFTASE